MAAHLLFIPQQQWPQLVQLVQFHNSWYSWYSWTQCLANAEHSGKIARRVKQKMYLVEKQLLTLARPQKLGSRTHLKIHTFSTLPQQSCYVLYLYVCVLVYSYTCIYVHTRTGSSKGVHANMCPIHLHARVGNSSTNSSTKAAQHSTFISHFYVEGIF